MPITAKLSRQFYEKLGDEVANELVSWFNAVDRGYREEFRDLFEAHFGRFEARSERSAAELRAEFRSGLGAEIGRVRSDLGAEIGDLRSELRSQVGGLRVEMARMETRLVRWMFAFWIGAWITISGTIVALKRLL